MASRGRKPGTPRAPGSGRQKGTPNKRTQDLMAIFDALEYDPAEAILGLLPMLEPEKQADVHLRLMKFKYPERKAIEHTGKDGESLTSRPVVAYDIDKNAKEIASAKEPDKNSGE